MVEIKISDLLRKRDGSHELRAVLIAYALAAVIATPTVAITQHVKDESPHSSAAIDPATNPLPTIKKPEALSIRLRYPWNSSSSTWSVVLGVI
jgi:hypothetical protein